MCYTTSFQKSFAKGKAAIIWATLGNNTPCVKNVNRCKKLSTRKSTPTNGKLKNSHPAQLDRWAVFFCLSAFCISPHVLKALSFNFSPYTSREKITSAFQPYKFTSKSCRKFSSINYHGKIARLPMRHSGTFCALSASGGIHTRPGRQKPPTGLWRPYRRPRLANYIAGRGRFAVSFRFCSHCHREKKFSALSDVILIG